MRRGCQWSSRSHRGRREQRSRRRRGSARAALLAAFALALASPGSAAADEYDPRRSGHPLRIVAYVAHPAGVILSELIFRPAHWVAHRESLAELFGHEQIPPDAALLVPPAADEAAPKDD